MKIVMYDDEKDVFITNNMKEIPVDLVDGSPRIGSTLIEKDLGRYNSINYVDGFPTNTQVM